MRKKQKDLRNKKEIVKKEIIKNVPEERRKRFLIHFLKETKYILSDIYNKLFMKDKQQFIQIFFDYANEKCPDKEIKTFYELNKNNDDQHNFFLLFTYLIVNQYDFNDNVKNNRLRIDTINFMRYLLIKNTVFSENDITELQNKKIDDRLGFHWLNDIR